MNKNLKTEVINLMKKDIQMQFKNISEEELNHFSNNLFVLCSSKANNVDDQAIANEIMGMNNSFIKDMEQKGISVNSNNFDVEISVYTALQDKYVEMLKSNS